MGGDLVRDLGAELDAAEADIERLTKENADLRAQVDQYVAGQRANREYIARVQEDLRNERQELTLVIKNRDDLRAQLEEQCRQNAFARQMWHYWEGEVGKEHRARAEAFASVSRERDDLRAQLAQQQQRLKAVAAAMDEDLDADPGVDLASCAYALKQHCADFHAARLKAEEALAQQQQLAEGRLKALAASEASALQFQRERGQQQQATAEAREVARQKHRTAKEWHSNRYGSTNAEIAYRQSEEEFPWLKD